MRSILLGMGCLIMMLAGCSSSYKVAFDYDMRTNFGSYRSYSWLDASNEGGGLLGQRVKQAVNGELVARTLDPLPSNADLFVSYKLAVGGDPDKPAGTLTIQLVDAGSKIIVWSGWATGAVDNPSSPQESQEQINKIVADIMKNFPPPQ